MLPSGQKTDQSGPNDPKGKQAKGDWLYGIPAEHPSGSSSSSPRQKACPNWSGSFVVFMNTGT